MEKKCEKSISFFVRDMALLLSISISPFSFFLLGKTQNLFLIVNYEFINSSSKVGWG